ncbi:MAG: zinc ribbon domain-containing protein [Phycisphaerae bacterium]
MLRIRCPYCQQILTVERSAAGDPMPCPQCHRVFNVPLPSDAGATPAPSVMVGASCPFCRVAVAPGTRECPRCHADLVAGVKAPFSRRIRQVSVQTWTVILLAIGGVALATAIGVNYWRARPTRPIPLAESATSRPTTSPTTDFAIAAATNMLSAKSPAELRSSREEFARLGPSALPALAAALDESIAKSATARNSQTLENRIAAIGLLSASGDAGWIEPLTRWQKQGELRLAAICGRAQLGDSEVQPELVAEWIEQLRTRLFLQRLHAVAPPGVEHAARALERRVDHAYGQVAAGLRALAARDDSDTVEKLADVYWSSWGWLGQERDESFIIDLFELAKPPEQEMLDSAEATQEIRSARRALERAAQRGCPRVAAVVGIVLAKRAPQYQRARQRVIDSLAASLAECAAPDQQRCLWALALLKGRVFGKVRAESSPLDVQPADVLDALEWVRASSAGNSAATKPAAGRYLAPPHFTRRVISPERQLEAQYLSELAGDWARFDDFLNRWQMLELPFTPRLREILAPGQRNPDLPSLAAAMMLAAARGADVRRELDLWREAAEQPGWVRVLAATTMASIDARAGLLPREWPGNLSASDLSTFDDGTPGWDHLARVIALGGPKLRQQLKDYNGPALTPSMKYRLLTGVDQAASRRGQ